jgi:CRP-like cAMP-binding protein
MGKTPPNVRVSDQAAANRRSGEEHTIPVDLQLPPCFERPLSATLGLKAEPLAAFLPLLTLTQMQAQRSNQSLLLELQDSLSADLFASAAPLRLAADEALFLAGDTGDGCYLVEDGLLKVVVASHFGGERILAFLGRGAIVGEMSVIDGRPRSASVVAVRQASLKFLSRASFEEFTKRYPDIYKYLMKLLASRLREANAVIAAGTFLSLKGRVARTLLELAEGFGQDVGSGRIVIHQKIGQSDLAAMAGIARANVSRIINEWKRQKLVSRLSGYYCLENRARLESESEM